MTIQTAVARVGAVLAAISLCGLAATAQDAPANHLDHRPSPIWDATQARGKTFAVDFGTNEGTWMSVDLSPDGQWLVFDMLGAIYRMPADGGTAVCLTQAAGVALNYHPRVSPDSKRIAFVSDRTGQANLWVMNIDGTDGRSVFLDPVTRFASPHWTADGTAIVAVREFPTYSMHRTSARIWRFPVDRVTDQPKELVGAPSGSQAYWPAPAPDGKSIYFMYSTFAAPIDGLQSDQHVRSLNLASGSTTAVTQPLGHPDSYWPGITAELAPEPSPDGRWLAFIRRIPEAAVEYRGHRYAARSALWIRDLQTGEDRILADPVTLDMQSAHGMKNLSIFPGYSWAHDSQSLVMWHEGGLRRLWLNGRVQAIPFQAHVHLTLSEPVAWRHGIDDRTLYVHNLRWPSVSQRRHEVVFESVGAIWSAEIDSGAATATPMVNWTRDASYFMPEVSPDGESVAFVSWNDFRLGRVLTCRLDNCRPAPMSHRSSLYLYPEWDADNKVLYALRSRAADVRRIASGDSGGFDLVKLTGSEDIVLQQNVEPHPFVRGPDGRLFTIEHQGGANAQVLLAAGKTVPEERDVLVSILPGTPASERKHLTFPDASAAALSPDGKWVAFQANFDAFVVPFTRTTAQYVTGEADHWVGAAAAPLVIKEDPAEDVRPISFGGANYLRWIDSHHVSYALGSWLHINDVSTHTERTIDVRVVLPKAAPGRSHSIALVGARIVPLAGVGTIESGTIVVTGTRIACVGSCSTSGVDKIVDVQGKTIVPGFIDVHAHSFAYFQSIYPLIPQHYPPQALYLAYGVTTTLDPSTASEWAFPVGEMIDAGRLVGSRSYATGEPLDFNAPRTGPATYREAEGIVQRLANLGADSLKVYLTPRRDQRQMFAEAARQFGLSVTNEGADLYYDVSLILDGHTAFEHPLQNLALYKDVVEFFGQSRATYSPTLTVAGLGLWSEQYWQSRADEWHDPKLQRFMPWRELVRHVNDSQRPKSGYSFPILAEAVKDIRRAGGYATLGGHGENWGLSTHWEMWDYAEAQTPLEVLTMASMDGAHRLGLDKDLGSLEVGKLADLVILNSNPLEDISRTVDIDMVMKGGLLFDANSLDEVWPVRQPYGTPPWYDPSVFRSPVIPVR